MKRCPKCNETYADDTMSFCLSDGTPLVSDTGGQYSSQATLVQHAPPTGEISQQGRGTNPAYANQSAPNWSQPTVPQYAVPQQQRTRSLMPWVLAGAAVLLLGIVGVVGLAAFIYSSSGNNRNSRYLTSPTPRNSNSKSNSNAKTASNDNDSNANNENSSGTDYSDRVGSYTGTATNTTNSPAATGDVSIEITEISDTTGAMKMKMSFSSGLCGAGESFGVVDKSTGEASLFGTIISSGGGCPDLTWVMTTRCTFSGTETLKCTYSLTSASLTPQVGHFEVTKQ
jgi:hypothetical protein